MEQRRREVEYCRSIHKHHGKSYYFATAFFPRELREATWVLYAFFRAPDEIVDNAPPQQSIEITKNQLRHFTENWRDAMEGSIVKNQILNATARIFHRYQIPAQLGEDFLVAMMQDTEISRYPNYKELKAYMWGSAAAVGHIMSHVIGFRDANALLHATALGEAMQLTNFLRDIKEDAERGRIYLPLQELQTFNVTEQELFESCFSDRFRNLMIMQIKRADALYEYANKGIQLLHPRGRFAVRCASDLYRAILRKIEQLDYNVFQERARTKKLEKLRIAVTNIFR